VYPLDGVDSAKVASRASGSLLDCVQNENRRGRSLDLSQSWSISSELAAFRSQPPVTGGVIAGIPARLDRPNSQLNWSANSPENGCGPVTGTT
jgi:hypothetical protein